MTKSRDDLSIIPQARLTIWVGTDQTGYNYGVPKVSVLDQLSFFMQILQVFMYIELVLVVGYSVLDALYKLVFVKKE